MSPSETQGAPSPHGFPRVSGDKITGLIVFEMVKLFSV